MRNQRDYSAEMGNRRQGQYPMTRGIRRQLMPNTPNAPNGRPTGQADSVPRKPLRERDENGMLVDPMKGSLNARVDRVMARNPGFNRENVMARQAGLHGMDMGAEGFDPNRLKQRVPGGGGAGNEEQLMAEQRAKAATSQGGEGGTGTQGQGSLLGGGAQLGGMEQLGNRQPMGYPGQLPPQIGMAQPGVPQQPNAAYPDQPLGYQSNVPRKPNAKWYRGGDRY